MEGWCLACWLGKWRHGWKVAVVGVLVRTMGISRSERAGVAGGADIFLWLLG